MLSRRSLDFFFDLNFSSDDDGGTAGSPNGSSEPLCDESKPLQATAPPTPRQAPKTSNSMGMSSGVYGSISGGQDSLLTLGENHPKLYAKLKTDFVDEMRHLSKLRHPCITTVMGAVVARGQEPLLVMELMEYGSLYDLLHNETMAFEGEIVLSILRDIAQGLRFLHSASPQVIHGDLKAANVLVDSKFRAKVADFGLTIKKTVGACGTPYWMAPELLSGESGNTAASDVYSFGMVLYELYSRENPYEGEEYSEVIRDICDPAVHKRPPVPKSMPAEVANLLMMNCLAADPKDRPTFVVLDAFLKRFTISNVEPGPPAGHSTQRETGPADKERSLLEDIFPKHVAEALRAGRRVEPEHHDCVTIFFSDVCSFTKISDLLSPAKVADMLDRLYLKFDALSVEHGLFKLETIGDAWVGVSNLLDDQHDHTKRIAEFSIDVMSAAKETLIDEDDPSKGGIVIRVGFHSGPIVASVVGSRQPKYALFGDTINTASRMESNSLPGRIQCSEHAAALLQRQAPDIPLLHRGEIPIKGKGDMNTYWVGAL